MKLLHRLLPTRLHDRVSLLVTALVALLLLLSGLAWGLTTRNAIREEVEAASRTTEQWLGLMARDQDLAADPARQIERLAALGRPRANSLEVFDRTERLRYHSPPSSYKAGRAAPAWFAALLTPTLPERERVLGNLRVRLLPDASRAVLDAWDELAGLAGWALGLLTLLGLGLRRAIDRALAPLAALEVALTRGAGGRFDLRLPACGVAELDRLAQQYNQMAAKLDRALDQNLRLQQDRAFSAALASRLEQERALLARELHDEIGQGMTAVRAMAGAIAQRSGTDPRLHGSAQAILALTGQMQDGVHHILQRLRRPEMLGPGRLDEALGRYCAQWSALYPAVRLHTTLEPVQHPVPEGFALALLRLLQESLTNVARHAGAQRVEVSLVCDAHALRLAVSDDGRGYSPDAQDGRHGVLGMRERTAQWGGHLVIERPAAGGCRVSVALPWPAPATTQPGEPPALHPVPRTAHSNAEPATPKPCN